MRRVKTVWSGKEGLSWIGQLPKASLKEVPVTLRNKCYMGEAAIEVPGKSISDRGTASAKVPGWEQAGVSADGRA